MDTSYFRRRQRILAACCLFIVVTACGSSDIPVSIHAVNYSDQEFVYQLVDVTNPSNRGGGESISRYGAGGTMCCFSLPKKWRPGIKIKIDYIYYLRLKPDGTLPEFSNSTVVDAPRYTRPEEIWVVRDTQGDMSIVSSNVQPDHPKWPGKMKGWPVPSLAYQRERADIFIDRAKTDVETHKELIARLKSTPDESLKKSWNFAMEYDRKSIIGYSGYDDVKYKKFLEVDYKKSLDASKKELTILERSRP